jgi:CDP-glycerol glycerophosphotransferase (TagB/SpsB family)
VLYAPTWEGESEANNYTSVDVYGPAIVAAVLAMPSSRLIYKPHPRVPDSDNPPVAAGHTEIMEQIDSAARSDPTAGHLVQLEGDVLAVIPRCDIVITDVSSVGLDFLYLKTENPLFITDRRTDRTLLEREAPVSRCSYVIDQTTIGELATALPAPLTDDSLREERQRMRRFYFGDGEPGDSTERFIAAVDELVKERDALVARRLAMGQIHSYAPSDD